MTILMCRLVDLREEYFSGMTIFQLSDVYQALECKSKDCSWITSEALIDFMGAYYDGE